MTRGVSRCNRLYMAGADISCSTLGLDAAGVEYETDALASWCEQVRGSIPGAPAITVGQLSGYLDTERLHALRDTTSSVMTLAFGGTTTPTAGSPVFSAPVLVRSYQAGEGDTISTVTMTFDVLASDLVIPMPFGVLLHALGAETGGNTGAGVDAGAATTRGAWMAYHVTAVSGTGSATISIEDSADNVSYAAVSGLTATVTAAGVSGYAQTTATATIRRYARWQLSLTGITSVTFALALMRGL